MMPFIQFTLLFVSAAMQPAPSISDRLSAGQQRFSDKWVAGFSASLMYWPLVNTFMYARVQPSFMNLYADMASLVFATIMSYITYKECCEVQPNIEVDTDVPRETMLNRAFASFVPSGIIERTRLAEAAAVSEPVPLILTALV